MWWIPAYFPLLLKLHQISICPYFHQFLYFSELNPTLFDTLLFYEFLDPPSLHVIISFFRDLKWSEKFTIYSTEVNKRKYLEKPSIRPIAWLNFFTWTKCAVKLKSFWNIRYCYKIENSNLHEIAKQISTWRSSNECFTPRRIPQSAICYVCFLINWNVLEC